MEFKEAFEAAKKGKSIRLNCAAAWLFLNEDTYLYKDKVGQKMADLAPGHYIMDTWEIKPEEFYVWGACDTDGSNFLFIVEPTEKDEVGDWKSDGECIPAENMTFPKDKPQKYKLVLMET